VAATVVEGLKTIVPAAGIASWYDYYNSQGTTFNVGPYRDLSHLSVYVSNRILYPADWSKIKEDYARYITQLNRDQHKHDYNYSDIWKNRDYTLHPEKFKASALVMHGLNDDNVRTKHFDLMYETLKKAGQPVKLYLYQGDHIYPVNKRFGIKEGQQSVSDLLNLWFSHYLYDAENQVESLPEVTVSNNYDPSKWEHYSSWKSSNQLTLKTLSRREEETIDNDYYGAGMDWTNRDSHTTKQSSTANALFTAEVTEDVTIKGHIPVHFQAALAKLTDKKHKDYQVNVQLVDLSYEEFDVASNKITYDEAGYKYQEMPLNTLSETSYWMGSNLKNIPNKQFGTIKTKYKVISSGWVNLANPDSGYVSASSSNSIDPKIGEFRNYTVYLQPNLYTVKKGHKLGLVFTTFDSNYVWTDDPYSYRLKTRSIVAEIPTVQKSSLRYAWYVPNEKDETYQVLPLVEEPLPEYPLDTLVHTVDQKGQTPNKDYIPYESGSLVVETSKKNTLVPLAVNYQQETSETVDENLPQVSGTRKEGLYLPQTGMTTNFEVISSVLGIVLLVGMGIVQLKEREN
jgi:LPXTG cell wall surface protein, X-prolyl dipeptidylaminopeptidase